MTTDDPSSEQSPEGLTEEALSLAMVEMPSGQAPPKILYHYTDQKGLLGIFQSRHIWATHISYLNDHRELKHGDNVLWRELDILKVSEQDAGRKARINKTFDIVRSRLKKDRKICVCSFSQDGDHLSQWRAYGGDSGGFSIGFSVGLLRRASERAGFSFGRCRYESGDQSALIRLSLPKLIQTGNANDYLDRFPALLKHSAFTDENEWRIISSPLKSVSPGYKFRLGKSMLIPYYCIPLFGEGFGFHIEEIVVGPTPHIRESHRSIKSLVENLALTNQDGRAVRVVNSEVPYRNW